MIDETFAYHFPIRLEENFMGRPKKKQAKLHVLTSVLNPIKYILIFASVSSISGR
ncbi:MAG: hypothetical protein AAGE37_07710 [Pseudomonadota bacterium]